MIKSKSITFDKVKKKVEWHWSFLENIIPCWRKPVHQSVSIAIISL